MFLFILLTILIALALLSARNDAAAHLVAKPRGDSLAAREKSQMTNLYHARYVCRHGAGEHKRWSCRAQVWLARELAETRAKIHATRVVSSVAYWRDKQIRAATAIASRASSDPWPNCPDPKFNGASWDATVACENNGNWLDSPGYYRCGLQFDPMWERIYGRLCP